MVRQSNFEALRIVALMMVVGIHVSVHPMSGVALGNWNWHIASLIGHISRPAVDIFVLIGAYFLIDVENYDRRILKRVWRIVLPVAIFSTIAYLYVFYISDIHVSSYEFLMTLISGKTSYLGPLNIGHLWFIYPYLILVCLAPLLNRAIINLEKNNYKYAIIILIVFFVIMPSINNYLGKKYIFDLGNSLFLFITLYFIAGYIKRFDVHVKTYVGILIFFACGITGSLLTWQVNADKFGLDQWWHGTLQYFFQDTSFFVFTASVSIFLVFKSLTVENKAINVFGKSTYEGYLIQNLMLFIVMGWIGYVKFYQANPFVFALVTLTIIGFTLWLSLGYGIVMMIVEKGLKSSLNRVRIYCDKNIYKRDL